ncbi:hypothetical protein L0337_33090 [candidate division KSB1 bacterium]|nr:hypothetical protein [candidate division KSB1 bacterium]
MLILSGHTAAVNDVTFSPNGARLATVSDDKTAKVWDAASGQELLTFSGHILTVNRVAFSPDGRRLATASDDKTVRVNALIIEYLIALAQKRVTRALTVEECRQYLHLERCPPTPF